MDGERLGELMEERFVDRSELAELSGVSYSTLYKMERRNYMPTVRKLQAVARALEVGPEELVPPPRRMPPRPRPRYWRSSGRGILSLETPIAR